MVSGPPYECGNDGGQAAVNRLFNETSDEPRVSERFVDEMGCKGSSPLTCSRTIVALVLMPHGDGSNHPG